MGNSEANGAPSESEKSLQTDVQSSRRARRWRGPAGQGAQRPGQPSRTCSSSAEVPGSCTRTRCTRLPSSGLTASTMAMVPFSYRSTWRVGGGDGGVNESGRDRDQFFWQARGLP